MPNTYVALKKETVTGSASASVTFDLTGISGYTDLVIVMAYTLDTANDSVFMRFNSDTTNNYSNTVISGNGTTAISYRDSSNTNGIRVSATNTAQGSATRQMNIINIMNYANATTYKTVLSRYSSVGGTEGYVGLWRKSPEAITSINLRFAGSAKFEIGSTFSLYGVANADNFAKATGGIIVEDSTYWYHVFGASGTFTPKQSLTADLLVVAGGAGGSAGGNGAGGGGAGGYRELSAQSMTSTAYTITVGAGGAGSGGGGTRGATGGNSSISGSGFTTITRSGGGGGGICSAVNKAGVSGGSGGGAGATSGTSAAAGTGNAGGYTPVEGYDGGLGSSDGVTYDAAGGGGGAGGVGAAATSSQNGNGGIGVTSSLINAIGAAASAGQLVSSNYYFAAGGGGGSVFKPRGIGGSGGGGNGSGSDVSTATAALANTGSGGGGSWTTGSNGGSGIVVIRYAKA